MHGQGLVQDYLKYMTFRASAGISVEGGNRQISTLCLSWQTYLSDLAWKYDTLFMQIVLCSHNYLDYLFHLMGSGKFGGDSSTTLYVRFVSDEPVHRKGFSIRPPYQKSYWVPCKSFS